MVKFCTLAIGMIAYATAVSAADLTGKAMVNAITGPCLEKVSTAGPLPGDGLVAAPSAAGNPLLAGGGTLWLTAMDGIVLIDPDVDFACQVLGRGIEPESFAAALGDWLADSGFALDGNLPLAQTNNRGLFLYGNARAGGYVTIHISNLPDNHLSALLTRAATNATARRLLN